MRHAPVANRLQEWREKRRPRGVSKASLARRLGISRSYVTRLEQGKVAPCLELALRIAQYFGCAVEDVFYVQGDA
ncbi:MAG: helix-turn-helix transcriptional regulator [Nitrospira sp.]|nr:helix-turn-helix transcriptional regulator [Nitrospira sp.]